MNCAKGAAIGWEGGANICHKYPSELIGSGNSGDIFTFINGCVQHYTIVRGKKTLVPLVTLVTRTNKKPRVVKKKHKKTSTLAYGRNYFAMVR